MARQGNTTAIGLGWAHQRQRAQAIRALPPGQPCPRTEICGGLPMYATWQQASAAGLPRKLWRLDYDDYPGRMFGGPQIKRLAHAHCNRSAGARAGNRMRRRRPRRAAYTRW
jgi:hypothetical protein